MADVRMAKEKDDPMVEKILRRYHGFPVDSSFEIMDVMRVKNYR
jgi:hypothetical protein